MNFFQDFPHVFYNVNSVLGMGFQLKNSHEQSANRVKGGEGEQKVEG